MLISFDGTFIIAGISFVIFMFIMKLILFKPLCTVIDEREKFYEKNARTAQESKQKAASVLNEKEKEISLARAGASNLVKEISAYASKAKEEALKKAKNEAAAAINLKKEELTKQGNSAKEELRNEINNFVRHIASKVLEKDIEINLDEEKINKVINNA